jgi:hypothetical protein
MKKLRPNQDTSSCKIGSSDLGNRKFRFWPKQRSNRLRDRIRFSFDSFPFRVRFLVERAKTSRLYICRLRPIVKDPSINRSIQFYLLSCLYPSFSFYFQFSSDATNPRPPQPPGPAEVTTGRRPNVAWAEDGEPGRRRRAPPTARRRRPKPEVPISKTGSSGFARRRWSAYLRREQILATPLGTNFGFSTTEGRLHQPIASTKAKV